jgi:hypothetical protein
VVRLQRDRAVCTKPDTEKRTKCHLVGPYEKLRKEALPFALHRRPREVPVWIETLVVESNGTGAPRDKATSAEFSQRLVVVVAYPHNFTCVCKP